MQLATLVPAKRCRLRRDICICNDMAERDFQIERGGTWTKSKGGLRLSFRATATFPKNSV